MTKGGSGGYVFEYNISTDSLMPKRGFASSHGTNPVGMLLDGKNGKLYGMTIRSGSTGKGTLFQFDVSGLGLKLLHNFNGLDGASANGTPMLASKR